MKHHQHQGLRSGGHSLKSWITLNWRQALLPPLAGSVAGLALPPVGWPWLLWLALVPLWSSGARAGALWGGAAVLVSHRWLLALHPLDWLGVPLPLSLPLAWLLLLSCCMAGALLVAVWCALVQRLDARRPATALLTALLWGLVELVLAKGPMFWIGLGAAVLPGDPPLAAVAQLGGAPLLASLQLLLAWLLWRRRWLLFSAGVLLSHGLGLVLLITPVLAADQPPPLELVAVQPNLPTRDKFSWSQQRRQLELLQRAVGLAERAGAAAVVLPEGALPLDQRLDGHQAVEILSGGFRREQLEERSSVLWFPAGATRPQRWLDKHRLVPLGEWVPLGRWSGLSAVGGVSPGEPARLLLLPPPLGPLAVAVCYELSDGEAVAAAVRAGGSWILTIANLDPYPPQLQQQFLAQARLRALESQRWLLSVGNTGPTAVIDSRGAVHQLLPLGQAELANLALWRRDGVTPWVRWGPWPQLAALALAGFWWRKGAIVKGNLFF